MICVPVRAEKFDNLKRGVLAATKKADVVEVWLDGLPAGTSVKAIRKITKKPLLAVCKGQREKGSWKRGEEKRIGRLVECADAGFEYVDVDMRTAEKLVKRLVNRVGRRGCKTKLIISFHDFKKTASLAELKKLYARAVKTGADVVKISAFANSPDDCLRMLQLASEVRKMKNGKPLIITTMGEHGRIGRIAAPLFGSAIVYAALDGKNITAPGQLTVKDYINVASVINTD